MNEAKVLINVIKDFIENKECIVEQEVDEEKLYKLAVIHKVDNYLKKWAEKYCKSKEIKEAIQINYNEQIIRDTNEDLELEQIIKEFEKNNIDTLIVKGITMKEVYPQEYMRQMCDIVIMIHKKEFKKASKIMKKLKFEEFYDHEKHLVFLKKPFILVELHRKLIPSGDTSHEYFNNIWPICIKYKNYKNIYRMTIEDSYIFCIIHLLRHFKYAGIKMRDILDVYLFYEKYKKVFNLNKINQKLEEFNTKEFEKNIREIAYQWFGTTKTGEFDEVEKFILKGESANNRVNYEVGENHGKSNYIKKLIFPGFKVMKEKYPILKKAPILLPVTWIARWYKDIFSKEATIKTRLDTIKLIKDTNQEEVEDIQRIYQKLGIIKKV